MKLHKILIPGFLLAFIAIIITITYNWDWLATFYPLTSAIILTFSKYSAKIFSTILLFFIFGLTQKIFTEVFVNQIFRRFTEDEDILTSFKKIFGFVWWFIYVIVILIIFAEGISNLVTLFGLIGLGFSLAFQKPILNIVGWFSIITKGIYKEGDRIEVFPIRGEVIRGDVIEIGLFYTTLRGLYKNTETKDYKIVSFPNEFILMAQIRNYSVESNFITDEVEIDLTLESDYEKAIELLQNAIDEVMKTNYKRYLRIIKKNITKVEFSIKSIIKSSKKNKNITPENIEAHKEANELKEKSNELEEEMKKVQELGDEFKARVHIMVKDSYIRLIGIYIVPYKFVRTTKTAIYLNFLKEIKGKRKIKIARVACSETKN